MQGWLLWQGEDEILPRTVPPLLREQSDSRFSLQRAASRCAPHEAEPSRALGAGCSCQVLRPASSRDKVWG